MQGRLFVYDHERRLSAFQYGVHEDCAILIAGLTEGPMSLEYTELLAHSLDKQGWALVLPWLSTSYLGYGVGSLQQDCDELTILIGQLPSFKRVLLTGHSTGCQISMYFMKHAPEAATQRIAGVILQAPASDRDCMSRETATAALVEHAKTLSPDELMPRKASIAPITAARYLSLADRDGADDMFSEDLSDAELSARIGGLHVPVCMVWSGNDEYAPLVKLNAEPRLFRLADSSITSATVKRVVIPDASHALTEHAEQFIAVVESFLNEHVERTQHG